MAAEKFPAADQDWSRDNPRLAPQLAAFRERYPLLIDSTAEADKEVCDHAWLLWVTGGYQRAMGRK